MLPAGYIALLCLVLSSSLLASEGDIAQEVLEVGYSAELFYDVDITDARAATKIWVEALIRKTGVVASTETFVIQDLEKAARSIRAGTLDLLVQLPREYLEIRQLVPLRPMYITCAGGSCFYQYTLLVRADSGTKTLADLRDGNLLIYESGFGNVAKVWLEAVLKDESLPEADKHFGFIRHARKAGQAVLPVFFGKADACVVSRTAFDTMVELNPQLGVELRPILESSDFPRPVISMRDGLIEKYGDLIQDSLLSLHTDPSGQQLLSLFHIEKLVPFEPTYLNSLIELLELDQSVGTGGSP